MRTTGWQHGMACTLAVAVTTSCSGTARQSPPPAGSARASAYAAADVRFMQRMIVHHEQALTMTRLVPARSRRAEIQALAGRIEASQVDEIERMRTWLTHRGVAVSPLGAHAAHEGSGGAHTAMPGMVAPEELARLEAATGAAFDQLFLELMIRHHEGALTMVAELFATEGAARDPTMYQFASHIDADQRAEIARMRRLQTVPLQRGPL